MILVKSLPTTNMGAKATGKKGFHTGIANKSSKPCTVKDRKVEDGLLLVTVHPFTVRVCVYCAVTALFNTVSVPSVTVMESLVQVTVVAGPPVEIQVRVN